MKSPILLILSLLMTPSLYAAPQTEIIGSYYKGPEQKAMECYGRGLRAKKKADGETDPAKQAKLYAKAVDELSKSVGYQPHYDGYLALGQVYLAMGNQKSGFISCSHALGLKPKSEEAKACVQAAQEVQAASTPAPRQDGGGN
jgi:tetratricopeptide (TPR) repeat protein